MGMDQTFCLICSAALDRRRARQARREVVGVMELDHHRKASLVKDQRQFAGDDMEAISIHFLDYNTSGALIAINHDNSYTIQPNRCSTIMGTTSHSIRLRGIGPGNADGGLARIDPRW